MLPDHPERLLPLRLADDCADTEFRDSDDIEAELLRAQASAFRHRMAGYTRIVRILQDGSLYWHLYYRGERVNGGLSDSAAGARRASWMAAVGHAFGRDQL